MDHHLSVLGIQKSRESGRSYRISANPSTQDRQGFLRDLLYLMIIEEGLK